MSSIPGVDCIEKTELALVEHLIDVEENQDDQTNDLVSFIEVLSASTWNKIHSPSRS